MSEHNYAIGLTGSLGCLTHENITSMEYTLAAQGPRASRKGLLAISGFSIGEVIIIWVCETCGIKKNKN